MLAKTHRYVLTHAVVLAILHYGRCQTTSDINLTSQDSSDTNTPSALDISSSSITQTTPTPDSVEDTTIHPEVGPSRRMLNIKKSAPSYVISQQTALPSFALQPSLTQVPEQSPSQNIYQNLPFPSAQVVGNNGGPCFVSCQQLPPGAGTVSQHLNPQQLPTLERVVLYLYALPDPNNPSVKRYYLYVPSMEKQNALPDLPLHTVDVLTEIESLNVPTFFPSSPSVIKRSFFPPSPTYIKPLVPLQPVPLPQLYPSSYLPQIINLPPNVPQNPGVGLVPGQQPQPGPQSWQQLPQPQPSPSVGVVPGQQPLQAQPNPNIVPGQSGGNFVPQPQINPTDNNILYPGPQIQQPDQIVAVPNTPGYRSQNQVFPSQILLRQFPNQPHGPSQFELYPTQQPKQNVTPRNPFLDFFMNNQFPTQPTQLYPGQLPINSQPTQPYYFPGNDHPPNILYGPSGVPSLPVLSVPNQDPSYLIRGSVQSTQLPSLDILKYPTGLFNQFPYGQYPSEPARGNSFSSTNNLDIPNSGSLLNLMPFEKWIIEHLSALNNPNQRAPSMLYGNHPVDLNGLLGKLGQLGINGVPIDTSNFKFLPLMIGTAPILNEQLPLLSKDKQILRNMPFIEAIALTTLNPPGIVGILPLGLNLPQLASQVPSSKEDWINLNQDQPQPGTQVLPQNLLQLVSGDRSQSYQPGQQQYTLPLIPNGQSFGGPLNSQGTFVNGLTSPTQNVISSGGVFAPASNTFGIVPQNNKGQFFPGGFVPQGITGGQLLPSGLPQYAQPGLGPVFQGNSGLPQSYLPYQGLGSAMETRMLHHNKVGSAGNAVDPQYRIIGGSPATGSGAPLNNKGRSGAIV